MATIAWLGEDPEGFPPCSRALRHPDGLLAAGGDLAVARLLAAYRRGIFPWYEDPQPILWWSPDPRAVLFPADLHVPRSLAKRLRQAPFAIRYDTAFAAVIAACAEPRHADGGTWIGTDMHRAYVALHEAGHAHSAEAWRDGRLVGGLYGVAIGRVFFGESMFAREDDASKIAFVHLARRLQAAGFALIDCQQDTAHLRRFGAQPIAREEFLAIVASNVDCPVPITAWRQDEGASDRNG
jgi:leucyl/phenylalanyl-tRNA--protein transferase